MYLKLSRYNIDGKGGEWRRENEEWRIKNKKKGLFEFFQEEAEGQDERYVESGGEGWDFCWE